MPSAPHSFSTTFSYDTNAKNAAALSSLLMAQVAGAEDNSYGLRTPSILRELTHAEDGAIMTFWMGFPFTAFPSGEIASKKIIWFLILVPDYNNISRRSAIKASEPQKMPSRERCQNETSTAMNDNLSSILALDL